MTHERPTEALSEAESDLVFGWSAISRDVFGGQRSPKQLSWMLNNTDWHEEPAVPAHCQLVAP
jgi:hypothetical protein